MSWRVTVRHGSDVEKLEFDGLDEAIAAARERAEAIRAEGGLPAVSAFRDYTPDRRVHARIEVSAKRLTRRSEAGLDIMGDGSLVPYAGAIRKQQLHADSLDDALAQIAESLSR